MESDLTTDACPSPPRQEEDVEEIDTDNKEDIPQSQSSPTFTAKKSKCFSKKAKTRCDNVIYINKSRDIHIGSTTTYTINMGGNESRKCDQEPDVPVEISPKIRKLMDLEEPVTRSQLVFLSGHIRSINWKEIARYLKYSEGQIDQFYTDHNKVGIKEVIYKLLLDWKQSEAQNATLSKLATSLWYCNEKNAALVLADHVFST